MSQRLPSGLKKIWKLSMKVLRPNLSVKTPNTKSVERLKTPWLKQQLQSALRWERCVMPRQAGLCAWDWHGVFVGFLKWRYPQNIFLKVVFHHKL